MKTLILCIALVLSGCGGSGGVPAVQPAPSTAPTPAAQAPAPAPLPPPPAGPVVLIGDSITAHWGEATWADMTAADTITVRLPGSIDAGVSSQTCEQMLARFATDVLAHSPSVVVIDCGTNDVALLSSGDAGALFAMVQAAQAAGARVIVGTLPPDTNPDSATDAKQALHASWNSQILAGAASYGYQVADYWAVMVTASGEQNAALFTADGCHPNAAGYAVMWGVLSPLVQP